MVESLLSKDSTNVSLDNQVKRHDDPMVLWSTTLYVRRQIKSNDF